MSHSHLLSTLHFNIKVKSLYRCYHVLCLLQISKTFFIYNLTFLFSPFSFINALYHSAPHLFLLLSCILPITTYSPQLQPPPQSPPSQWLPQRSSMHLKGILSHCPALLRLPVGQPARCLSTGLTGHKVEDHHWLWVNIYQPELSQPEANCLFNISILSHIL